MTDPFAAALDALYASPMAAAADYTPVGGASTPVRVIRAQPTVDASFGSGGGALQDSNVLKARRSEIAEPATGDLFDLATVSFRVDGEPSLDVEGMEWTFGVVPA
ncbi:MAG: head-tail joining protein [Janthinobacterium lividum]